MALDTSISLIDFPYLQANYDTITVNNQGKWETLINEASYLINSYCGRTLKSTVYTGALIDVLYDSNYIPLPNYPVTAIANVYVDESKSLKWDSTTLKVSTDYTLNLNKNMLYFPSLVVPAGIAVIKADITAGYSTIPYDLQGACAELTLWLKNRRASGGAKIGERSGNLEGITTTNEITIPLQIKSTLDNYKRK